MLDVKGDEMWDIDRHVNVSMCHKASRGRWNRVEKVG